MLVLVCGDRNWTNRICIEQRLAMLSKNSVIIHGAARGADTIAGEIAKELGLAVRAFPADWDRHGRAAGPIRNRQMLDEKPDLVIAFHNDLHKSKGTKDTLLEANRRNICTEIVKEDPFDRGVWE
jgi:hypothetical protein